MNNESFNDELSRRKSYADSIIHRFLPKEDGRQKTVIAAMNYSLLSGGKRLRPILMNETWRLFGGKNELLLFPFMAAMEMLHTFSLVHDDLPAIDNDLFRRGKKTTHAVYNAGIATLAGDGLLILAFETALSATGKGEDERVIEALKVFATKAGIYGMVGGESADVENERVENISDDTVRFIHEHKTANMIESSLMIGGILAGAGDKDIKSLEVAGNFLGVAFQIRDDILNTIGDEKELGKPVGTDERKGKANYARIYGIERSQEQVINLSNLAADIFDELYRYKNVEPKFLSELARQLIQRKN